jgi:hypothetical protein
VVTTALPAEYGHSGGGVMSITYKSGTNQLHGLAEERYMARHMIHRNFQDANLPTNNFGFHLMSGNLSGPVVLPKLYNGRNRTFFLVGFQRHHEKASENADADVPSPAMLAGDFSFGGIGDPVYDPASLTFNNGNYARTQFPGNQIPLSRVDPVFNKFMSFDPYQGENNRNNQAFINRTGPHANLSADTVYRSYHYEPNQDRSLLLRPSQVLWALFELPPPLVQWPMAGAGEPDLRLQLHPHSHQPAATGSFGLHYTFADRGERNPDRCQPAQVQSRA